MNHILVINCGSSSVKFSVINPQSREEILSGIAEQLNSPQAQIRWKFQKNKQSEALSFLTCEQAIDKLGVLLDQYELTKSIQAIGHRVVHGGEFFSESCLVSPEVLLKIKDCSHLAPLHNPMNIKGIEASQTKFPHLSQVAVFDTAFHQSMPPSNYLYAIPYYLYKELRLRRYGMHGISYRYVSATALRQLELVDKDSSIIIAHLGNGASACAVKNGYSLNTTMGLTPLEGLVMGTRSGDIDPNVFSFLSKHKGMSIAEITHLLNEESGLLGLSELDSDCRVIEDKAKEGNAQAQLSMDVFCASVAKKIATFAAELGKIDALIFCGGIGENSAYVRQDVINRLGIFKLALDVAKNQQTIRGASGLISTSASPKILVIPTNEELMIASDTYQITR